MTQTFKDAINGADMRKVLPYLLAGGVGATAGVVASSGQRTKESRKQHLARVLKNALLAGGLAAGGAYAVNKGIQKTVGSVDKANPVTGSKGNEGPLAAAVKGVAFSPLTAGAAGATALGLTHNAKGILGAGDAQRQSALAEFASEVGDSETKLREVRTANDIGNMTSAGGKTLGADELNKLRRAAGLASDVIEPGSVMARSGKDLSALKGAVSSFIRKGPLSTLGQTTGRRVTRTGLGLTAAAMPAIIGALTTSDNRNE
jgi:hypothetical protein